MAGFVRILSGKIIFALITPLIAVALCSCPDLERFSATPCYTYKIVQTYPHDPYAFTEGLVFEKGFLYESTGLNGSSTLRKVELETGNILQLHKLPAEFFGEGITIYNNRIIQLTYRSNVGFVYDKDSFELLQTFDYPTDGWGFTYDGKRLIMSDGTSTLYFLDPQTFREVGCINVHDKNGPVSGLNELEYVKGQIFANVWPTGRIVIISPQTGKVIGWIDLNGLLGLQDSDRPVKVLNGIAYDAVGDRLFVTGKFWPKLFEIKLVPLN
jgi:glutamine cyclotransferase